MFSKSDIGKIFTIKEISEGVPCKNCSFCVRLRLLEMGLNYGDKFKLDNYLFGLWKLNILSENGTTISSIALREDEVEKICVL
jgi:Fe2+ transport system protein FeoA